MLRHGLEEISAAAPEPGEDEALDTQAKRLADADALRAAADEARMALIGDVAGDLGGGEVPQDATAALAMGRRGIEWLATLDGYESTAITEDAEAFRSNGFPAIDT